MRIGEISQDNTGVEPIVTVEEVEIVVGEEPQQLGFKEAFDQIFEKISSKIAPKDKGQSPKSH